MNPVVRAGLAALCSLALAAGGVRALAQDDGDDTVKKTDKSAVTGKIESEDLGGISIKVTKAAQIGIPWGSIASIEYVGTGAQEIKKAKVLVAEGKVEDAIALLEDARKKADLRPILKAHVLHMLGAAYLQVDAAKSIATYDELFKAYPRTQFLVLGGGENLINAYLATGNSKGAEGAFKMLESGAKGSAELNVLRGRVQEATGDFAGAAGTYAQVVRDAKDDVAKAAAELGVGRCLWGQKKVGEAEAKFRGLVSKQLPSAILAGAWNGLGDVLYKAGTEKPDAEVLTTALFNYMRGVVLYVPLGGEPTREHERAIRGAADCFKALGDLEQNADRKKVNHARSRERLEYLKSKFPNSPYLK